MAEEQTESEPAVASPGRKKWIWIGAAGLAVIAIGASVAVTMSGPDAPAGETVVAAAGETKSGPPIYQSLHPPLVVNFKDRDGDSHYMQITMEVMSRKQSVINAVREHTPAIRNALILLYGSAVYENVETRAGKERMLADGRAEIERIVAEAGGEKGVEALYFTDLVIQ